MPEAYKKEAVPSVPTDADQDFAALAKALAHPARVAILRQLLQDGDCVCGDLVGRLPLAQSTVSEHLKILKSAGFVRGTLDGPRVCYCADPEVVRRFVHEARALEVLSACCTPQRGSAGANAAAEEKCDD